MIKITNFEKPYIHRILDSVISGRIDYPHKLLALGAGKLRAERKLMAKHILAVDWVPTEEAKKNSIVCRADIRNIPRMLEKDSFDMVTMFDVIEHLTKEDGLKLLRELEKRIKQIVLFVPIEEKSEVYLNKQRILQEERKEKGLTLGHHLSCWTPEEFDKLGYDVEVSPEYHKEKGIGAMICIKTNEIK